MAGKSDPLIGDALQTILDRGDFVPALPDEGPAWMLPGGDAPPPLETDPAIVTDLIESSQASIAAVRRGIRSKSGSSLLDFILADIQELKRILFDPRSLQVIMAGMEATWWLNDQLQAWLGEKNAADTLAQSVPHNVTSEMGLALLDVADVIRPHPNVVAFLRHVEDEGFLDELPQIAGGREARDAIRAWLDTYGMRCVGEIDITRPRWSERPSTLVPLILGNIRNFAPGAGQRRFEHGRQEAWKKERELLQRLRTLPDGERKAEETKRMIDRVRTFVGYREYPKYGMVSRYFVYKQALLQEAERLVQTHVLREQEDIFYLTFQELQEVVRTHQVDGQLLHQRKDAFRSYQALTPPRVLTSDGEAIAGAYRRDDVPPGALVGLPVSAGTVEGRARVILDMAEADLEAGDILVTAYTDPSWTPLFVAITGLVTEVGGLMTHGAVIAREYGLPAVVGVEHATRLIRDTPLHRRSVVGDRSAGLVHRAAGADRAAITVGAGTSGEACASGVVRARADQPAPALQLGVVERWLGGLLRRAGRRSVGEVHQPGTTGFGARDQLGERPERCRELVHGELRVLGGRAGRDGGAAGLDVDDDRAARRRRPPPGPHDRAAAPPAAPPILGAVVGQVELHWMLDGDQPQAVRPAGPHPAVEGRQHRAHPRQLAAAEPGRTEVEPRPGGVQRALQLGGTRARRHWPGPARARGCR